MIDPRSMHRMLNKPVKLHWAGWETDTYRLGAEGWQISVEQDVLSNTMRIAINHPKAQIQGITQIEDFLFREMMDGFANPIIPTLLRFEVMGRQIYVNQMRSPDVSFAPVDFRPTMVENVIHSLDDFCNFAKLEIPKHEIFLHEANINQILEMALVRQEPDQERIRQEVMRTKELKEMRMGKLHTELRLVV